jgi:hypothetical protein
MVNYLVAAILGLLGLLFFSNSKRKSAEALNTNLGEKEKILTQNSDIAQDQAKLQEQAAERALIEQNTKAQESTQDNVQDLTNFLNNSNTPK